MIEIIGTTVDITKKLEWFYEDKDLDDLHFFGTIFTDCSSHKFKHKEKIKIDHENIDIEGILNIMVNYGAPENWNIVTCINWSSRIFSRLGLVFKQDFTFPPSLFTSFHPSDIIYEAKFYCPFHIFHYGYVKAMNIKVINTKLAILNSNIKWFYLDKDMDSVIVNGRVFYKKRTVLHIFRHKKH